MKLSELKELERKRALAAQARKVREESQVEPDLPGVRSSGLVRRMDEDEKKALFEKLRKESGL